MNRSEKIEHYIEGLLTGEEKKIFEQEIRDDPELAWIIRERRSLLSMLSAKFRYPSRALSRDQGGKIVDDIRELEMDDDLYRFYYHYDEKGEAAGSLKHLILHTDDQVPAGSVSFTHIIVNIAASLLLLAVLSAGFIRLIQRNRTDHAGKNIYAAWFRPGSDANVKRLMENEKSVFGEMYSDHLNGGSPTFPEIYPQSYRNSESGNGGFLVYAIRKMQEGNLPTAENIFQNIALNTSGEYSDLTKWYYALTLLGTGKTAEAKKIFEILCRGKGDYSSNSCKILADFPEK